MIDTRSRTAYTDEHALFRDQVRRLIDRDLVPNMDRWERAHLIDREFWRTCGAAGLLCPTVPEAYGGPGLDFSYNAIVDEELGYAGFWAGLSLHSDIVADYIVAYGSEEQKKKYLPGMVSGDIVAAIAMTEPGAGSDLQGIATTARRDGGDFVINGSKIYITNGYHCDIMVVVAKTDPAARGRGMSLIIVEADTRGFDRGTRAGRRAARVRGGGALHAGSQGLRQDGPGFPEYPVHPGRPCDQAAGGLGAYRLGDPPACGRRAHARGRGGRQGLAYRSPVRGCRYRAAAAWRRGLYE